MYVYTLCAETYVVHHLLAYTVAVESGLRDYREDAALPKF